MPSLHRLLAPIWVAVALLPARSQGAVVVRSRFPSPDVIIAVEVLRPPAASADATPSIQQAIDRAAAAGGGTVFLSAGRYRLEGPVTLREGVVLRGEKPYVGRGPRGGWAAFNGQGTVLMPVHGRGSADGPGAITMERGTGVTHLSFWYPDQRAESIQPYPWTIEGSKAVSGDNYTVRDVLFVNAYQAMRFGPEWNELHTVQDVCGTPLKTGIFVDTCTDIGRLTDIDFSPRCWETASLPGAPSSPAARTALRRVLWQDAVGVDMGRSDWEYQFRVRVSGLGTGFRYRPGAQGTTNGVMFGCEATACRIGLDVVEMNGVGLAATLCRFDGAEAGVRTRPSHTAVTQLNDCAVTASRGPAMKVEGRGTVTACRCRIGGADVTGGRFVALGCQFHGSRPHVRLGQGIALARVLACTEGSGTGSPAPVVVNERPGADVVVEAKPIQLAVPRPLPGIMSVIRRPTSSALVLAAAHGVSARARDNTRALQAALTAAGKHGGTVYLAAGRYRVAGSVVVPSGVELRGSFDVPHHTQSGGSVLLATGGRGQERGTPLIRLKPGAGVRGLTVWYPEQSLVEPVPYPWTVQSLGPRCWMTDVTVGNGWQGADFFTYPSTGHIISYFAGGFFRRGLFVSKSEGGQVEDVQYNPHYMARVPATLPRPTYAGDPFGQVIAYQQAHLEGLVFGRCRSEQILRTFLYSAVDGLRFVNDKGGTSGIVINHGTDAGSRAVTFEAVAPEGIDLLNTQLVVLGRSQVAAVVTLPAFRGTARLFNTQIWAPGTMASLDGPGRVVLQQFNDLTGPVKAQAGTVSLAAGCFQGNWQPAITLGPRTGGSKVVGCIQPRGLFVSDATGKVRQSGNSTAPKPRAGPTAFVSGFESPDPQPERDAVQAEGGGLRAVSGLECRPAPGVGRGRSVAVRFAGNADDPDHSYAYCRLFRTKVIVHPDTVLTYWMKPANALSMKTGLDLLFDDGSTLRDSGASDTMGRGAHPGTDRGAVGQWQQITVPLGHKAGDAVTVIMAAFDGRPGGGPFDTLFDDIAIRRTGQAR